MKHSLSKAALYGRRCTLDNEDMDMANFSKPKKKSILVSLPTELVERMDALRKAGDKLTRSYYIESILKMYFQELKELKK